MSKINFSTQDKVEFMSYSIDRQNEVLGNVLRELLMNHDIEVHVSRRLSKEVRDQVLDASNRVLGANYLFKGLLQTVGLAAAAGALVRILELHWLVAFLAGAVTFMIAGSYINRRRTQNAIANLCIFGPFYLKYFWKEKVICLYVKESGKMYSPEIVKRWEDIVLSLVGWDDLQKAPARTSDELLKEVLDKISVKE